jgi:hypothetical protein
VNCNPPAGKISSDHQRGLFLPLALSWLMLPGLVFLATWMRPCIGIPASLALIAGWYQLAKGRRWTNLSVPALVAAILAALFFELFGGVGGLLPQSADYIKHNLIFHDLAQLPWPVHYPVGGPENYYLCYGLGYYLMPALGAKCFGEDLLAPLSFLWTFLGLVLIFYWVAAFDKAPRRTLPVFLLFSATAVLWFAFKSHGLPGLVSSDELAPRLKQAGLFFSYNDAFTRFRYQPQHALGGWLGSAVLYELLWREKSARGAFFVWAICLFWSPLSAAGLLVIPASALLCLRWRHYFEPINLAVGIPLLFIFGLYFTGHVPLDESGPFWKYSPPGAWLVYYLFFIALELSPLLLLFLLDWKYDFIGGLRPVFYVSAFILLLLPLYKMGYNSDLRLEASGPPLLFASLAASRALALAAVPWRRPLALAFAVSFLIGACYPCLQPWLIFRPAREDFSYPGIVHHQGYHNVFELRDLEFDSSRQYLGRPDSAAARWLLK